MKTIEEIFVSFKNLVGDGDPLLLSLQQEDMNELTEKAKRVLLEAIEELKTLRENSANLPQTDHAQKIKEGLAKARQEGKSLGSTPLGFDRAKNGSFAANLAEQTLLDRIRFLRSSGLSYRKIAYCLNDEFAQTKHRKQFHASTIYYILKRDPKDHGTIRGE